MARTCLFCGGGPVTKEHVFSSWLDRVLVGDPWVEVAAAVDGDGRVRGNPRVMGSKLNATARVVCRSCNSGWMSQLEGAVAPILAPLIRGEPATLLPNDLIQVGRWVAKTAMIDEYADRGETKVFSPESREALMRNEFPPIDCRIRLAAVDDAGILEYRRISMSKERDTRRVGVSAGLRLGAVLFHLIYAEGADSQISGLDREAWETETYIPVWPPPPNAVRFPPQQRLISHQKQAEFLRAPFGFQDQSRVLQAESELRIKIEEAHRLYGRRRNGAEGDDEG